MLFSILIPVYNVEKYLNECVDSVLNQKYGNYEIVLVDDGSTDRSGEICDSYNKQYPDRVKVIHKKNEGLLAARQDGFFAAKGDYCICLDSDDFFSEDSLVELARIIDEFSPDFIMYDLFEYHEDRDGETKRIISGKFEENRKYNNIHMLKDSLLKLKYTNWSMCGKCIKREFVLENDFRAYYNISFGEDTLQTIVLFNRTRNFVYTKKQIYNYRAGSGMTKKLPVKYLEDFYVIIEYMKKHIADWSRDINTSVNCYYAKILYIYLNNVYETSSSFSEVIRRSKNIGNIDKKQVLEYLETKTMGKKDRFFSFFVKNGLHIVPYMFYRVFKRP